MGEEAPAEHIVASIVTITGSFALPLAIPFFHRYSRTILVRTLLVLSIVTTVSMAYFSMREVFDEMHQKRLFVIHMENVRTSPSFSLMRY